MTNTEFAGIVGYITNGCGKSLTAKEQLVYFDCLGDLDMSVMELAAKRVLMEHKWHSFPSIAELRQAAVESMRGEVKELSGAEAWELAWRAVGRTDPEQEGSADRAMKGLPATVREAVVGFGLLDLCYGKEPLGVLRGQFIKHYEQLAARDRRAALLPPKTHEALENIRERRTIAAPVRQAIEGIGREVA